MDVRCRKNMKTFIPGEEHSAKHVSSGNMMVLSTPSLIGFVENAAREIAEENLTDEFTSVGTMINIKHIRASKIGQGIDVHIILLNSENGRFTFYFEAFSNGKKIASGTHERAIVNRTDFLKNI
ncbi:MAG: thioesterase family protein [Thermoplasmata archaeon]